MPNPARFTSGVGTANKGTALFTYPAPDPTKVHTFFDDFSTYTAGDWTVTTIGTGTTATVASDPFGSIASTQSAADNDGQQHQLVRANFTPTAGKKLWFKTRIKVSDATQSDVMVGLGILDTTILGAVDGAGLTDGIFFSKDDDDTQWDIQVQKNTTTGQTRKANVGTATTNYVTLAFDYDGASATRFYIDDVQVWTLDSSSSYLPDTILTPSFAILNGEAVAKVLTVDYLFAAIER